MRLFQAFAATLALACAATAGTTLTSYADPATPDPQPVLPEVAQAGEHAAEQALANAQAALTGAGELEPTLALVELVEALPQLEGDDRRAAEGVLARPTDAQPQEWEADYGGAPEADPVCGPHICVHYVDPVAAPLSKHRATAQQAIATLDVMEQTWTTEIGTLQYRAPRKDGTRGLHPTVDTSGRIDVYLAQLDPGLFGYAVPEVDPGATGDGNSRTNTAHMVLDKDFNGFDCEPQVCRQATAAHEFFHVVQFGYDTFEDGWLMESTATWMEERVFDDANDNRNYLRQSSLRYPARPIDTSSGPTWYGNWVFHEFYTQRLGTRRVKNAWYYASRPGVNARSALDRTLRDNGSSLRLTFRGFAIASNIPTRSWQEGWAYPKAAVTRTWTLSRTSRDTALRSTRLNHLTSRNYRFVPGKDLPGAWKLRLRVDAPNTGGTAYALVHHRDGKIARVPLGLGPAGNTTRVVRFSASNVVRVTLNLGNSSSRDNRTTRFRATVVS